MRGVQSFVPEASLRRVQKQSRRWKDTATGLAQRLDERMLEARLLKSRIHSLESQLDQMSADYHQKIVLLQQELAAARTENQAASQ